MPEHKHEEQEQEEEQREEHVDASIESRTRRALGEVLTPSLSAWAGLMAIYHADREAFYLLACDGVGDDADSALRALADLASRIRFVVRSTYQVEPGSSPSEAVLISRPGDAISLPTQSVA